MFLLKKERKKVDSFYIFNFRLAAGMPPEMPVYGNWLECMRHLYSIDQLNRGSSTWNRRGLYPSKLIKLT